MHQHSILLSFLLTFLKITSGQGDNSTLTPSMFVDVNGTQIEKNNTHLLKYIHSIYDSVVDISNDFSRFPMSDKYDPVTVSILFIIMNTTL